MRRTVSKFGVAAAAVALATFGVAATALADPGQGGGAHSGHVQLASGDNGVAGNSGSAVVVNEGHGTRGALLTSNEDGYGLASVNFSHHATFDQLTHLSTDFDLTSGVCVGGSPRFQVDVAPPGDNNPADVVSFYVYFGTQPYGGCPTGQNTEPDAVTTPGTAWWVATSSGVSNTPDTYQQVEATYGTWDLLDAQIAVDGGWAQTGATQQVLVSNFTVSNRTYFSTTHGHAGHGNS